MPTFDIKRFSDDGQVTVTLGWRDHLLVLKMNRYLWAVFTAVLTWASFVIIIGWQIALIFVSCIFFHELGHALAAAVCRQRKINIEFIPLFGAHTYFCDNPRSRAAATGIFLSGPALGLLAGWVGYLIYILTASPAALSFAAWSMVFSLANLLPLGPLDGGQALSALLAPARVWLIRSLQISCIALAHIFLYWLGMPLVVIMPSLLVSLWVSARHMRKVTDVERIYDALGELFSLPPTDVVRITQRVGEYPQEELMLETAGQARRRYRRFLGAASKTYTDDDWFSHHWALTYYLQGMAPRSMAVWGKLLGWLSFGAITGLCLLLGYLLVGGHENTLVSFFISAFMLF